MSDLVAHLILTGAMIGTLVLFLLLHRDVAKANKNIQEAKTRLNWSRKRELVMLKGIKALLKKAP